MLKAALTGSGKSATVQTVAVAGAVGSCGGAAVICLEALQSATTSGSDDEIIRVDVTSPSDGVTARRAAVRTRNGSGGGESTTLASSAGNGYGDYKTFQQTANGQSISFADVSPSHGAAAQAAAISTSVSGQSMAADAVEHQVPDAAFLQVYSALIQCRQHLH